MPRPIRSSSIIPRLPFSRDTSTIRWLFEILPREALTGNCYTNPLVRKWSSLHGQVHAIEEILRPESTGPRRRMLVISVSEYRTDDLKALSGAKSDWKIWALLGIMSGWTVEVLADTLPISDPTRYPTKENIQRFAHAHLQGNNKGDQLVVAYSGHGDDQGLILADGSQISSQELRDWFVKPLTKGSSLWSFFDCCYSSNLLGLHHKILHDENQNLECQPSTEDGDGEIQGTVICIGSAAGLSGELDLDDPKAPSQGLQCGPLAFAAYSFFYSRRGVAEPLLTNFLPGLKEVLSTRPEQEAQIFMSGSLQNPVLPIFRALV